MLPLPALLSIPLFSLLTFLDACLDHLFAVGVGRILGDVDLLKTIFASTFGHWLWPFNTDALVDLASTVVFFACWPLHFSASIALL